MESGTVGWPAAIDHSIIRLLLPCPEDVYVAGDVDSGRNEMIGEEWWPPHTSTAVVGASTLSGFAWLCRIALLVSRLTISIFRPYPGAAAGPLAPLPPATPDFGLSDLQLLSLDEAVRWIQAHLDRQSVERKVARMALDTELVVAHFACQALTVLLHFTRTTAHDESDLPSAQYSLQRLVEAAGRTVTVRLPAYLV